MAEAVRKSSLVEAASRAWSAVVTGVFPALRDDERAASAEFGGASVDVDVDAEVLLYDELPLEWVAHEVWSPVAGGVAVVVVARGRRWR